MSPVKRYVLRPVALPIRGPLERPWQERLPQELVTAILARRRQPWHNRIMPIPTHRSRRFQGGDNRLSANARGYGRRWEKYRRWFLSQPEHAVCAICQRRAPTDVDHIEPVDGPDDPKFWDPDNHQGLCHRCHSRKTAAHDGGFGRAQP